MTRSTRSTAQQLDQNVAAWAALVWLAADSDVNFRGPGPRRRRRLERVAAPGGATLAQLRPRGALGKVSA